MRYVLTSLVINLHRNKRLRNQILDAKEGRRKGETPTIASRCVYSLGEQAQALSNPKDSSRGVNPSDMAEKVAIFATASFSMQRSLLLGSLGHPKSKLSPQGDSLESPLLFFRLIRTWFLHWK